MALLHRPLVVTLFLALVATLLVPAAAPRSAEAAPLTVYEYTLSNGMISRRIEVPYTIIDKRETWTRVDQNDRVWDHCAQAYYYALDEGFFATMPGSTGYGPNGNIPRTIGTLYPQALQSFPSADVRDLSTLVWGRGDKQVGAGYGYGFSRQSSERQDQPGWEGCDDFFVDTLPVPHRPPQFWDSNPTVTIDRVAGSPNTYRFRASATHPVIGDLPLTYRWYFERDQYVEGADVVHTFTGTDPEDVWHRRWRLSLLDDNGTLQHHSERQGRVQSLNVSLTREGEEPVLVGEEFDVELTVAAGDDNPGMLTDVQPVADVLTLPDWLEVASGDLVPGFDLGPGQQQSATITLRAVGDGNGEVVAAWRGTDAFDDVVVGEGTLPVTAVGTFDGDWFRVDPSTEGVKEDEVAPVRLRVENITDRDLTDVELVEWSVEGVGETPGEAELTLATSKHEGQEVLQRLPGVLDATGPGSVGFEDFTLHGVTEGDVVLRALVRGTDPDGAMIEGTIEEEWFVRATDLTIEITFDPPDKVQQESDEPGAPPEPVEMSATVTMKNTSGGQLTGVTIAEFEVSRLIGEQQLWLEQVGGLRLTNWDAPGILLKEPVGTDDPLEPFAMEDEEVKTFTADFIVRDDGQIDVHMLALAADEAGATVRGYGENSWVLTPDKYLEVTTEVISPQPGELLDAGEPVVIKGRIVNLSQTASLEVGPVIPVPSGNTGQLSLAYGGGRAPDPTLLPGVPGLLELGPGDSELFEVAIATGYSDPRTNLDTGEPEVAPTGGTRAYFEFDPWAIATEADGTVRTVRTDPQGEEDRGVKMAEEHRNLQVSIDDSIPIPELDYVMLAGGIGVGVVTGIAHAGVGLVVGAVETIKLPYTLTVGAMEYQSRVWNSFTDEEKTLYTQEMSTYLIAMAVGNVENGLKDAEQLKNDINDMVYVEMTRLANEWETGDYVSTAEAYAAGGSEIAASLWMPAAMTKLAQTPRAAAALERTQLAVNARMGPIFDSARGIRYVEDALPLLRALENGAEISADAMRALYGVSPEEVAELQRLASKYKLLITFRSRHPSSVQWMQKFGAMMKPEAIKIKSVSEMDVQLGYREGDLGSVVFRKPEVLKLAGDGADDLTLDAIAESFIREKGFVAGTKEYDAAKDRVALRVKEWRKHEEAYKAYDRRRSIPTEFDYEGNAIPDLRSPSSKNKQTGFKLEQVGDEEYIVRLLDPTDGKYKRVTGDIDPIAFTNLDGSPLTAAQHRDLVNDMRRSALLRAQHPESATFVGIRNPDGTFKVEPGLDFIEDQFKPGEAAAQIGPAGPARAVRLNKAKSRWEDPFDYHLHWEGGQKHVSGRDRITQQTADDPDFGRDVDVEVPAKLKFKPLELGREGETTYGRATIKGVATGTGTAVFVGEAGELIEVLADGSTQPYAGNDAILEEGEPIVLEIAPAGEVGSTTTRAQGKALFSLSAAELPAVDGVVLVDDDAPVLFAPGQVVAVGVQDGQGELRTIASVNGRQLLFTEAVVAAAGDIVVMVQPAPVTSDDPSRPGAPVGPDGTDDPGAGIVPRDTDRVCATTDAYDNPFSDLLAADIHYRDLLCLTDYGIARGFSDGTYRPSASVTRDQMASFVAHMIELERDLPEATGQFEDVGTESPHWENIHKLAQAGVVLGRDARAYAPRSPVTREQMASFIARAIDYLDDGAVDGSAPPVAEQPGHFSDVIPETPHSAAIDALYELGVIVGYGDGTYGPRDHVRRDQMASFIMRAYDASLEPTG